MDEAETRDLIVREGVVSLLLEQAGLVAPDECCGLLLGPCDGVIARALPVANVARNPRRHFEIDPRALLDAHKVERGGGERLIGYYHSHPVGKPAPSPTDRKNSTGDFRIWAIIGQGHVAFWRDSGKGFVAQSWRTAAEESEGGS